MRRCDRATWRSAGRMTRVWTLCLPLVALSVGAWGARPAWGQKGKARNHGEMPPPKVVPGEKVSVAYMDLARKRFEAGDLQGALAAYDKARAQAPKDPRPLALRGEVYREMK